jgi:hydrogenase maturation protease
VSEKPDAHAQPVEPATVVLGVGNELMRDEGVGVAVARALAAHALSEGVRVVEGGVGGLDLLFEFDGADRVIIVDAAEMGLEPGAVRVFTPDDIEMGEPVRMTSLHGISLLDVLELGRLTGIEAEVVIVGIQPAEVAPGLGLTAAVEAAVGEAERLIADLLA